MEKFEKRALAGHSPLRVDNWRDWCARVLFVAKRRRIFAYSSHGLIFTGTFVIFVKPAATLVWNQVQLWGKKAKNGVK